jgi:hypothetical protein
MYDTVPPPAIGNTELIPIRGHEIAVQYTEMHIRIVIKWNKIDVKNKTTFSEGGGSRAPCSIRPF